MEASLSPVEKIIQNFGLKKCHKYPFASPDHDGFACPGGMKALKSHFSSYEATTYSPTCLYTFKRSYSQILPQYGFYELRNALSADLESVYYINSQLSVDRYSLATRRVETIVDIHSPVSAFSAKHGLLVAGSLEGCYKVCSLTDDQSTLPAPASGIIGNGDIINHVHTCISRSGATQAMFCSNDKSVQTLDVRSNTWASFLKLRLPANCSASSADGNSLVLVFDHMPPQVVDRDGHPIALLGHTRSGFACAWAPDDRNIVTAHEDGILQVYDFRNTQTVKEVHKFARIQATNGCIRSLEFSSTGPPLLVAAEENDFVHILDAKTYEVGQTIQCDGDLTGVGFAPEGQSLFIGNSDQGILHYAKEPEIDNYPLSTMAVAEA